MAPATSPVDSSTTFVGGGGKSPRRSTPPRSPEEKYKARKATPRSFRGRKHSGPSRKTTPATKDVKPEEVVDETSMEVEDEDGKEVSFEDHEELCKRMAKTFYFANKLPTTPRPSLPLTMLAVNTFTRTARKDTLEYLDVEKAAEIGRNACVSPTALIMALVYLDRLSYHNPSYLKTAKPSELFVVSLLVASKFIQDDGEELGIFNDEWATSAELELKKLNKLELEFLTAIDWKVNVGKEEYDKELEKLEGRLALQEGAGRGWFTYTELNNLTNISVWNLIWPTLYHYCIKVITAAYVTYATLLATLVTSSILVPHIFLISKGLLTTPTPPSTSLSYCYTSNSSTTTPTLLTGGNDSLDLDLDQEIEMIEKMNFSGNFLLQDIPMKRQQFTNPGTYSLPTEPSKPHPPPPPMLGKNGRLQQQQKEFGKQLKNLMKLLQSSEGTHKCQRGGGSGAFGLGLGLREMCGRGGFLMKV